MSTFVRRTVAVIVALTAAATAALAPRAAAAQDTAQGTAQGTAQAGDFTWNGRIPTGRWIYVKNLNGPIRVERGTGSDVVVTAEKIARDGGDPSIVRIVAQKASDGQSTVICAFWNENGTCDESRYRGGDHDDDDDRGNDRRRNVSVEFLSLIHI